MVGIGRAGTTSLYKYLGQHPEIYMSPIKEPRFFIFEGVDIASIDNKWKRSIINDIDSYKSLFDGVTIEKAYGEASTEYFYHRPACTNIKRHIPNAKIIVGLRNPVYRVYSHYVFCLREELETELVFSKAMAEDRGSYLQGGFYSDHLVRFYETFPRQNIYVYLFEDLNHNTPRLLRELFSFLDVNHTIPIRANRIYNRGQLNRPCPVFLAGVIDLVPFHRLRALVQRHLPKCLLRSHRPKPELDMTSHRQLIELYREDIMKVESIINRDLSHWLRFSNE